MAKKLKLPEQKADSAHLVIERQSIDTKDDHLENRQNSLAARLRKGDRIAAVELVEMYYEQIFLYMRRLGHDRQTSEDLTQEAFLNAWYHIGQLKEGKALTSWLFRIASNVSKLYWRRHKSKQMVSLEWVDAPEKKILDPDRSDEYEQLEQLRQAVAELPNKLKEIIVLHYLQHLTIAEVAEAANIRQGTCKSRLSRALKILRKRL
ncbi:MAG: RNA polymerase sigma factor [Planctomycetota bacterium]|jgi:RNA polymerase sigma-70 factor (ECF subfamily)